MQILTKYWKALVAVLLVIVAVALYLNVYEPERVAYEAEVTQLKTLIASLESSIQKNRRYESVQDQLEEASAQVDASRLELYEHFPVEMKEEDQIMYVIYLEQIFGTEIDFAFSSPEAIVALRDGSTLMGLTLDVNYETTYQGFKDMVNYLATDSRITSVRYASIDYDAETDTASGRVILLLYLIDSDLLEYLPPEVTEPNVGKDNIYE